jgi:hypothetical protein
MAAVENSWVAVVELARGAGTEKACAEATKRATARACELRREAFTIVVVFCRYIISEREMRSNNTKHTMADGCFPKEPKRFCAQ